MAPRRDFIKQTGIILSGMLIPVPVMSKTINSMVNFEERYDVIITGGSYAGLAAGMALGRALKKVLIVDGGDPCNRQTPHSHNFLTNDGKAPAEIARLAREEVSHYSTVSFLDDLVTEAIKTGHGFEVKTRTGQIFSAGKLVFATGIKDIMPAIPGFAECWGISILHCPYCHGYEVRHQKTGILANGDTAFELSALLSNWTSDLTVFTNGLSTLTPQQDEKLRRHNVRVVETGISRFEHEKGYMSNIIFNDGSHASLPVLYARLSFLQHCSVPQALGCGITAEGYIQIDAVQRTTVPGVYACGDNASRMRTVANAVSMGTAAGIMVNKELIEEFF